MTCCIVQIANACSGVIHPACKSSGFDIEICRAASEQQKSSC